MLANLKDSKGSNSAEEPLVVLTAWEIQELAKLSKMEKMISAMSSSESSGSEVSGSHSSASSSSESSSSESSSSESSSSESSDSESSSSVAESKPSTGETHKAKAMAKLPDEVEKVDTVKAVLQSMSHDMMEHVVQQDADVRTLDII